MADSKEKAKKEEKKEAGNKEGKASSRQKEEAKPKWTLEEVKRVSRRFNTEAEWRAGHQSSYKSAEAHGWVADCVAQMNAFKTAQPRKKAA